MGSPVSPFVQFMRSSAIIYVSGLRYVCCIEYCNGYVSGIKLLSSDPKDQQRCQSVGEIANLFFSGTSTLGVRPPLRHWRARLALGGALRLKPLPSAYARARFGGYLRACVPRAAVASVTPVLMFSRVNRAHDGSGWEAPGVEPGSPRLAHPTDPPLGGVG